MEKWGTGGKIGEIKTEDTRTAAPGLLERLAFLVPTPFSNYSILTPYTRKTNHLTDSAAILLALSIWT